MSEKKKEIFNDERFAHLLKDPRYKKLPNKESKVKIDERFKPMLKDERFSIQYNVDKYGRKVNKKTTEDLKKYYELSSSDDSESDEEVEGNAIIKGGNKMPENLKDKLKNLEIDYVRGEGILKSDSSDEESSNDDDEVEVEHEWGELDQDAERTEDSTRRIACMHMDWDRIRAVDIMMLCNSFIPVGGGSVLSVKIYPSEFGKERMAEEDIKGPRELTTTTDNEEEIVDEESEEYREKLRQYQLNRLKYYYAVVEFDSVKSADIVYKECDGLEYESTANKLDFRFIPDDMEFEDEPKDSCTEFPDLSSYEPRIFFTSALQHAKVELTWDETDVGRKEISEKLFADKKSEIPDHELKKYVAFSSESEEEEENDQSKESSSDEDNGKSIKSKIDLYKSLINEINQKEEEKKKQQVEMEYTWSIGDSKKMAKSSDSEDPTKEELTPFEKILEKKKLKKKAKKQARKKKLNGNDEEEKNGYSSSDFDEIDMNDPYFAEEFQNDEFEKPKKKKKDKKKKFENDEHDEEKLQAQKELELLLDDGNDDKAHFSLKKIQENEEMSSKTKKRKLKKLKKKGIKVEENTDNFELNVGDERFKAVFNNPNFNIDPSDSSFKKTKGMEKLIQEKIKRRYDDETISEELPAKKKHKDVQLNMLVKNIKRKVGK